MGSARVLFVAAAIAVGAVACSQSQGPIGGDPDGGATGQSFDTTPSPGMPTPSSLPSNLPPGLPQPDAPITLHTGGVVGDMQTYNLMFYVEDPMAEATILVDRLTSAGFTIVSDDVGADAAGTQTSRVVKADKDSIKVVVMANRDREAPRLQYTVVYPLSAGAR